MWGIMQPTGERTNIKDENGTEEHFCISLCVRWTKRKDGMHHKVNAAALRHTPLLAIP